MFKKIITLGILFCVVFSLAGCANDVDKKYNGLSIGFNYTGSRYHVIMCATRSEETTFDIDDVTLDFYFGWFASEPPLNATAVAPDGLGEEVRYALYFTEEELFVGSGSFWHIGDYCDLEGNYFIRKIFPEEFTSETFRASQTKCAGKIFNHSESITIPKEMFSKPNGRFWFRIQEVFGSQEKGFYSELGGNIGIYYEFINDNTVRLSKY